MNEISEQPEDLKEKRGRMLLVLAVLSWSYIGIVFLMNVVAFAGGKASAEEMIERKVALIDFYTSMGMDENPEALNDAILIYEKTNDQFYLNYSTKIIFCLVGFFAVLQMFRLQKTGYWAYIAYSLIPLVVSYYILKDVASIGQSITWDLVWSALFITLYGTQLKRMA